MKIKTIASYHTADSKRVKQEVYGSHTSPFSIPWYGPLLSLSFFNVWIFYQCDAEVLSGGDSRNFDALKKIDSGHRNLTFGDRAFEIRVFGVAEFGLVRRRSSDLVNEPGLRPVAGRPGAAVVVDENEVAVT